jgi:small subunit ribosomal protein S6
MRPYEVMIVFSTEIEEAEIEKLVDRALDLLRSNDAVPGAVNRWGRRALAYEVKHQREGHYVLVEFSAEPKVVSELDRFLLLLDEVLRHKIVRLPEKVARQAGRRSAGQAPSAPRGRAKTAAAG